MRINIIEAGLVANTIECESLEFAQTLFPSAFVTDADLGGEIGDSFDIDTEEYSRFVAAIPAYDIDADRVNLNLEINAWRARINFTSFPYLGKTIACDVLSRSDIDVVASYISLFGTFTPNFPGAWKAMDNSYVPLPTVDDFKAMYAAMAAQGTANFNASQVLKLDLAAAETKEDMGAIREQLT